ncbi:Sel1 domain-containing protein [Campylobacter blaseri]|uniref:beta-lactamase n=1 Tax=Campylobacter blaseri TaxID=2042961 RepID=A0A2P8R3J4_9BACT|nr:tetratricopeptide repeat protein [Campylobacter blaseri]PSM53064.1 hypothetical protein CQ405_00490 [Campylobacter blaseri]PSM54531.1 hypothetical protein CRN67_00490 [Campylobacter blaseri]QKF86999.1 Sel1 domain-containing protein [Campylobacter blaseri]
MKKIYAFLMILIFCSSSLFAQNKYQKYVEKCEHGDSWACAEVGMTNYKHDNLEEALIYFDKGCKIKFSIGCELKAFFNKSQKPKEAFDVFQRACDNNSSYSCLNLAMMYEYGEYVEKNITKATKLFSKSCKLGDKQACYYLNLR